MFLSFISFSKISAFLVGRRFSIQRTASDASKLAFNGLKKRIKYKRMLLYSTAKAKIGIPSKYEDPLTNDTINPNKKNVPNVFL